MKRRILRLCCLIKAVKDLWKYNVWIPHVYTNSYEQAIIIASAKHFRVADSMEHEPGEKVYPNACLIRGRCIYCGKENRGWIPEWSDRWKFM